MKISLDDLKKLRAETSAGIADCRQALEDADGDYDKAKKLLQARGLEKAAKKEGKATSEGMIESYIHTGGKIGVLVEIGCETDFVARNEEFKKLAHELAMQIAATSPKDVPTLLKTEYIRDASVTMDTLVKQVIAKVGENISVTRFVRYQLGE
jgi:elongation factor Ts